MSSNEPTDAMTMIMTLSDEPSEGGGARLWRSEPGERVLRMQPIGSTSQEGAMIFACKRWSGCETGY